MVIVSTLIKVASQRLGCSEAELARDHLRVSKTRLYEWKTYRVKMPTRHLYHLTTLAGNKLTHTLGQYQIEWHTLRCRLKNGESRLMNELGLQRGGGPKARKRRPRPLSS